MLAIRRDPSFVGCWRRTWTTVVASGIGVELVRSRDSTGPRCLAAPDPVAKWRLAGAVALTSRSSGVHVLMTMGFRGMATRFLLSLGVSAVCFASACEREDEPTTVAAEPQATPAQRGDSLIYVPAYAYATPDGVRLVPLATTLTIHNVSATEVTIRSVEYHDSPGNAVRSYLRAPQVLNPLETTEFVVRPVEDAEGAGANFIVSYDAPDGSAAPLVEALMTGNTGSGWLSFTSRGVAMQATAAAAVSP